jgi:hypothetical protein
MLSLKGQGLLRFAGVECVNEVRELTSEPVPISTLLLDKDRFEVDRTYQREEVWSRDMAQYLIDSILRKYDIGKIYVQVREGKYFIIDGQQRLKAIWDFADNKFPLSDKYSSPELAGKFYKELPERIRESFRSFSVTLVKIRGFTDEEVRDLFRRINSGVPLNTAERLNAYPGNIVLTVRKLSEHSFFEKITYLKPTRYRYLHVSAQLLMLEKNGITDISPKNLFTFFEQNRNLDTESQAYRNVIKTLNYLERALNQKMKELEKPSWIITLYLLTSLLLKNYVMDGKEEILKRFFINFYQEVLKSAETGGSELVKFNLNISRGTTSRESISFRHRIILTRFLTYAKNLLPLDPKREYTEEERIVIFRMYEEKCQRCGEKLRMEAFHVHHKIFWAKGGQTTLENALLLCEQCHRELHKAGEF